MKTWVCSVCGYEYSEEAGDPAEDLKPGTKLADIPAGWVCPECGAPTSEFKEA